jgi:hypothetical protein
MKKKQKSKISWHCPFQLILDMQLSTNTVLYPAARTDKRSWLHEQYLIPRHINKKVFPLPSKFVKSTNMI